MLFLHNGFYTTTREDMIDRIRRACAAIPRKTLLRTVQHFQKRVNLCLEANGAMELIQL